jgi:hypothetical protein
LSQTARCQGAAPNAANTCLALCLSVRATTRLHLTAP